LGGSFLSEDPRALSVCLVLMVYQGFGKKRLLLELFSKFGSLGKVGED
jgi:hypothetical protein